jgi:hypothetical protein
MTFTNRELMEWDWLENLDADDLHYAEGFDGEIWERDGVWTGTSICGVEGRYVIPGIFTRMGENRCDVCCERTMMPKGVGSPKNDDACRPFVQERLRWLAST